jgi:hypothetical protein
MICEDCEEDSDDVELTHCPYADELGGVKIAVQLCSGCYGQRCMDI